MRRALLVLALLSACGPVLTTTHAEPPVCDPTVTILLNGDPDPVSTGYVEALELVERRFGFERPNLCGVHVAVWPIDTWQGVQTHCHNASAEACVNVDPEDGFYLMRYWSARPEHLRHEWLHVFFSELDIPREDHHVLMNRADVYFYPSGKNLDDE